MGQGFLYPGSFPIYEENPTASLSVEGEKPDIGSLGRGPGETGKEASAQIMDTLLLFPFSLLKKAS